jgi:hypothetical protein
MSFNVDQYNADYFGLPIEAMPRFNELAKMKVNQWPEDLRQFVQRRWIEFAGCSEVIFSAIADWMKQNPERAETPVQRVTDETDATNGDTI